MNWRTDAAGKIRFVAAMLAVLMLLVMTMGVGAAEEAVDYNTYPIFDVNDPTIAIEITDFKVRLRDMGFYSAGVGEDVLHARTLDDLTLAAVRLVCTYNPELTYYEGMVSYMVYWRVMGVPPYDAPLKTPKAEQYYHLREGQQSSDVTRVQNRLNQLGYDAAGYTFTPGLYDKEMQAVIREFVRCNKFVYSGGGIPVEMQERMFSEEAVPYFVDLQPEVKKSLGDKIFDFLGASTAVMGVMLPNAVLLVLGFVMLCAIVFLGFMLFSNNGSAKGNQLDPAAPMSGPSRRERLKPGEVEFRIEYGGASIMHRANVIKECVRIGRETGHFPLNMSDGKVSRKHCEICYDNNNLMLTDFSFHGTYINGALCHRSQQVLHSGDTIQVGGHKITITF